eukprot:1284-Heterococcus_DN1.PRE.3
MLVCVLCRYAHACAWCDCTIAALYIAAAASTAFTAAKLPHCCYCNYCCYTMSSPAHTRARTQALTELHGLQSTIEDNEESTEQLLELLDALITVDGDAPEKWTALRRAVVTLVNNNCVAAAPQLPPRSSPTAVPTVDVTSESVTVSAEAAAGADRVGNERPSASEMAVSNAHNQ